MGLAHWRMPIVMQFAWYKKALIIVKHVTSALRIIGTDSNVSIRNGHSDSVDHSVCADTHTVVRDPAVTASVLSYQV